MDLEELKASWQEVGDKVEKQLQINTKLLYAMTSQRYKSRLSKITYTKYWGGLGCLGMAVWVSCNFGQLDTPVLRVFGALSILLLIALVVSSAMGLRGLHPVDMTASTYADTLRRFTAGKIRFQRRQRFDLYLSLLFIVAFTPIPMRLIADRDITRYAPFWWLILPLCIVAQYFVSRWVYRCYVRTLLQAEAVLAELDI